jgi:polyprenyl-phospho-N-acetylgalactosaminyl synthase
MPIPAIFVIVPAFNEETALRSTVSSLLATGYTIVVVDDGSAEKQSDVLQGLMVHYLQHPVNLGQGAALQTGNAYALKMNAEFIVHFDSDGQHLPENIQTLLQPLLENKCDVTFGSRFLDKKNKLPFSKKVVLQLARMLNFFLTGLLLTDAHNGLRAMNRNAAEKIILRENRMAHASEILFLVKKNKLRFKEVPVEIRYSDYSTQKGQSSWNSIRIFFDLLLHKLFE